MPLGTTYSFMSEISYLYYCITQVDRRACQQNEYILHQAAESGIICFTPIIGRTLQLIF